MPFPSLSNTTPQRIYKSVQMAGGNLFQLAAIEFGDATQWNRIAQLNNLFDPFITGNVVVWIPPVNDAAANGGILVTQVVTPRVAAV